MAEAQQPFLPLNTEKNTSFPLAKISKWFLKSAMWLVFLAWVAIFFLAPCDLGAQLYDDWVALTGGTLFGETGSALLLYNGPILVIAFLAIPCLILSKKELEQKHFQGNQTPTFRLWTFPVLVEGPFGVISAAELIGILIFLVFVIWAAYAYTITNIEMLSTYGDLTPPEKRIQLLQMSAYCFGLIALACMAFLFLPVARGSILLRLIDIPFGHATRYHMWLGHLTMFLLTLHGLCYLIEWKFRGILLSSIVEWKNDTGANFAGVISYMFGLFMWVTTLPPMRKRCFEVFFYCHQFYVLFVFFFALHVGDTVFSKAAGGIFLFLLDRLLRFCQSRRVVNIVSATTFPCGTVKLELSKPGNLPYNPLSFIFLRIREISWLQWHPFSVSSSPLEATNYVSVLVKAVGGWTSRLREKASNVSSTITASVEGPYGHELPYYIMYRSLILVAGGSGISPFLAILSDILHRIEEQKSSGPRDILLFWAVKSSDELLLLSTFEPPASVFSDELDVKLHIYVTRESEPSIEEGDDALKAIARSSVLSSSKGCSMPVLVGTGHTIWSGTYIVLSSIGFVICLSFLDMYYINPFNISDWWYKGLLLLACMVISILVFGVPVIGLWNLWGKILAKQEGEKDRREMDSAQPFSEPVAMDQGNLASLITVQYGCRPDFKEIFGAISDHGGRADVCVIVCGPATLQSSVAEECRSQNLRRKRNQPIFHYNSHSFDF